VAADETVAMDVLHLIRDLPANLAETYVEVASYERECDVPQFLKAATRAIDGRS